MSKISKRQQARQGKRCQVRRMFVQHMDFEFEYVSKSSSPTRVRVEGVNAVGEKVVEYLELPTDCTPVRTDQIVFPPHKIVPEWDEAAQGHITEGIIDMQERLR